MTRSESHTNTDYRVLLLEDVVEDAQLMERELRRAGLRIEVRRVSTEVDFLKQLREFAPHIVLADYELPGFTAVDALRRMREERVTLPFILVTGSQSEEIAVECMKQGADDYLLKASLTRLPVAFLNAIDKEQSKQEKERTEIELRRRERLYRLITENTRDLICMLDEDGRFIYVSPSFERVLGHPTEKLIGSPALSLVYPDDRGTLIKAVQEAHAKREGRTVELRCRHRDGTWYALEATGDWILDEQGEPRSAVVVSRDISERRRLEEQLRQAQKMEAVARLADGVAHDFNNLLTTISGYSDLFYESLGADDSRRADLEEVKEAVHRASALTRQLLSFSQKQITQPSAVSLNQTVANVDKLIRRLIGDDVEMQLSLSPDLQPVRADAGQMEQVLVNVVLNARDAMPKGGYLAIKTANVELDPEAAGRVQIGPGRYAAMSVSDTGTGMDEATVARLFEPFFTTKGRGGGTGLGLSTTLSIVKQWGGGIGVSSRPGKGSVFTVYLPAASVEAPPRPSTAPRPASGPITVLLVEDEQAVRSVASRILSSNGYRVLEAKNGEDALNSYRSKARSVDLLVTDVVMQGVSGPDLARRLVSDNPKMRVIYVSGYSAREMLTHFQGESDSPFLPKPFRPRDLIQKVSEVMGA